MTVAVSPHPVCCSRRRPAQSNRTTGETNISIGIAEAAHSYPIVVPVIWRTNWEWGLPLIVSTVLIHVLGLGLIREKALQISGGMVKRRYPRITSIVVMSATTLLATSLHAMEAAMWASAYRLLGALPDNKSAMLYSLSAITSYGHASLFLEKQWQLLGAMEALNGWLLFGLTTAFLFGMMDKVWLFWSEERSNSLVRSSQ